MLIPSNELACRTLFYHAASDGRAQALFGPYWEKTCDAVVPYTRGVLFPKLYLEFPLKGDPFLDVTALIDTVEPGGSSCPETVAELAPLYDWVTKLHAAEMVNQYDTAMIITNSRKEDILGRLMRGEETATVFYAGEELHTSGH